MDEERPGMSSEHGPSYTMAVQAMHALNFEAVDGDSMGELLVVDPGKNRLYLFPVIVAFLEAHPELDDLGHAELIQAAAEWWWGEELNDDAKAIPPYVQDLVGAYARGHVAQPGETPRRPDLN